MQFHSLGVDETACFILKYKNGAMANISINVTVKGENTALIFGDKGSVKVPYLHTGITSAATKVIIHLYQGSAVAQW